MDPSRPHQRRLHAVAAHVATASATEQRPQRALEGVRVLEMATVIAGPMSAAVLGDLGATVIKLESPEGDTGRSRQGPGVSGGATFENYNRGKAGVVLDLKSAAGLAAFRGLLAETDVFVTNVRRKSLESLGIDYEQLKEDFPALIYAHVTGWGRSETSNTGQVDAENEAAFDIGSFYARSGMAMALRQSPDSPLSQWPGGIGDLVTSLATAQGITAALFQRERGGGGQGQLVETSLLHTGIFTMGLPLVLAMLGQNSSDTIGWIPTRKSYECKDGIWFQMLGSGGSTRAQLPRLIDALGLTETLLPLPEGFWSPPHEGAEEVVSAIRERFSEMDSVEVGARFAELDVWATVVNTPASLLEDERALQLGAFFRPEGAGSAEALKERGNPFKAEALHLLRSPMNLGGSAFVAPARAPMLGQHTEAVLMEQLGYSKEQAREAMGKHGQD